MSENMSKRKSKVNRSGTFSNKNNRTSGTFYHVVPKSDVPDLEEDEVDTSGAGKINLQKYDRIYMLGEKNSGFKIRGPPQNYHELLAKHIQDNTKFEDENFAPESIKLTKLNGNVEWKRPPDIVSNPEFIVGSASRFDVDQGKLGDCWFLAAIANLTANQKLFPFVVPEDQSFAQNYAGIFHFRFWQYGRWIDIVIDDRLPTINGSLVYLRSNTENEFWTALLEKAYAKLYGSYKNIEGGQISEALEDMCGGLSEFYYANRPEIFEIMDMSYQRLSFMGCSIVSTETEGERPDGLITTHAYSITKVLTLPVNDTEVRLLRLRNPWGGDAEWNGAWSDNSEDWLLVPKDIREHYLHRKPDGEFWIQIEDFQKCFTFLDIVHLGPSSFLYSEGDQKKWNIEMFEGSWVANVTAGGGIDYPDTIGNNPQYYLSIKGSSNLASYSIVIGLMQENRRFYGEDELPLELNIYRVTTKAGHLLESSFFKANPPVLHKREDGIRQLTVRTLLPVGKYCIIPSTAKPNIFASYLLRIYSEVDAHVVENDNELAYADVHNTVNNSFENVFKQVAGDDKEVGWYKVQKALNIQYAKKSMFCFMKPRGSFSKSTCKNLIALRDADISGKLDYNEFWQLLKDVASLRAIFKKYDVDKTGTLNGFELRKLLLECGYKINRKLLVQMLLRYGINGSINFEDFIICVFKLRTKIDEFHKRTANTNDSQMQLNLQDWLQTTLYS